MINWGPNGGRNTRRDKKGKRFSSTAGSTKGENCMASTLDRYMAKSNRSYKHSAYVAWSEKKRG